LSFINHFFFMKLNKSVKLPFNLSANLTTLFTTTTDKILYLKKIQITNLISNYRTKINYF
jgi:hypothetical protein